MKKTTLKTGIGSGKNAAKFLGAAFCAITLTLAYSCSADGDYEEPWLNKEFKTRAGSNDLGIERDLPRFKHGETEAKDSTDFCRFRIHFQWGNGVEFNEHPDPTGQMESLEGKTQLDSICEYNIEDIEVESPWQGSFERVGNTATTSINYQFSYRRYRWENGAWRDKGIYTVHDILDGILIEFLN